MLDRYRGYLCLALALNIDKIGRPLLSRRRLRWRFAPIVLGFPTHPLKWNEIEIYFTTASYLGQSQCSRPGEYVAAPSSSDRELLECGWCQEDRTMSSLDSTFHSKGWLPDAVIKVQNSADAWKDLSVGRLEGGLDALEAPPLGSCISWWRPLPSVWWPCLEIVQGLGDLDLGFGFDF